MIHKYTLTELCCYIHYASMLFTTNFHPNILNVTPEDKTH